MEDLSTSKNKRRRRSKSGNVLYKPKSTKKTLLMVFLKLLAIVAIIGFLVWAFEGTLLGWNDYTKDVILQNAGQPKPIELPK